MLNPLTSKETSQQTFAVGDASLTKYKICTFFFYFLFFVLLSFKQLKSTLST